MDPSYNFLVVDVPTPIFEMTRILEMYINSLIFIFYENCITKQCELLFAFYNLWQKCWMKMLSCNKYLFWYLNVLVLYLFLYAYNSLQWNYMLIMTRKNKTTRIWYWICSLISIWAYLYTLFVIYYYDYNNEFNVNYYFRTFSVYLSTKN